MSDHDVLRMPRLGESIVEATIVRWNVGVGDEVQAGTIVVEVETDKATNDIPAPRAGRVAKIHAEVGATVDVGAPLFSYAGAAPMQPVSDPAPPALAGARIHRLAPRPVDVAGRPGLASPAVRRLAREHRLDLNRVSGTGRRGRITRSDLLDHLEAMKSTEPTEAVPISFRGEVIQLTGRRRKIAENLAESVRTAVQVFALAEIDMSQVQRRRRASARDGRKPTFLPFVLQAVLRALKEVPHMNATLRGNELRVHEAPNLGIAVDTDEGLTVPVIHGADRYSLSGLSDRIEELADRARNGRLTAEDLAGGTFTVSNPGAAGNLVGVSVLRTPEVGILRTGTVTKRPVVQTIDGEDHLVVRPIMMVALTYDHRAIDGRTGNRFLRSIQHHLEGDEDL